MLKVSPIKDIDSTDGIKILVARTYPKFIKHGSFNYWFKELAPSFELLNHYHQYHDYVYYRKKFILEMNNIVSQERITFIKNMSKEQNVTLFCYEPDGQFCHRNILLEMIEQKYVEFQICPFFCKNDAKRRCYAKNNRIKIGHAEICDFYGDLSGNSLKQCLIFCQKTKNFTCKKCVFNNKGYSCLLDGTLGRPCSSWVSEELNLGNLELIKKIMQTDFLEELRSKSKNVLSFSESELE
jgi:uncharacterized protein YeaO (DUF488 family)